MSPRKRKRPGKHTVHTKHRRYNVSQYPRGSGGLGYDPHTLEGYDCEICGRKISAGTGERLSGGLIAHKTCLKKTEKRKPDYSKSTIIYANSEDEARSKVKERFGAVRSVQYMGKNDMGNPYYRVVFIPRKKKKVSKRKTKAKITKVSQNYSGPYGSSLHDVWITVDGKHYFVPSVPGNTIDLNKKRGSLGDLIKLSGTETREREMR